MECARITKIVLPAIRISLAESMSSRYGMSQSDIALRLGIAQVAVSKYLSGRYSESVKKIKNKIVAKGLANEVSATAARTSDSSAINAMVNELCARIVSSDLVGELNG